jgi:hypothetical protein
MRKGAFLAAKDVWYPRRFLFDGSITHGQESPAFHEQSSEIIQYWNNGLITSSALEDLADETQILEQDRDLCTRLRQNEKSAVCA